MNSGVSPIGRADEKLLSIMARGLNKFQGKASVRKALEFYPIASRQQASQMNYHLTDTLALSALVEDIIGSPLSYYFMKICIINLVSATTCAGLLIILEQQSLFQI